MYPRSKLQNGPPIIYRCVYHSFLNVLIFTLYFSYWKYALQKFVREYVGYIVLLIVDSSFSSFCCALVANAPNVLQPYWLIVLPLDIPYLTASLLLWGPSGQRWRCLWTLFSNVPTFATSRLQEILAAKGGTTWVRNGRWMKMPDFHLTFRDLLHAVNLRHWTDGFTSPPKEGVLRIFSPWKIQWLCSGLNPRTWVPKASTLPLDHQSSSHWDLLAIIRGAW